MTKTNSDASCSSDYSNARFTHRLLFYLRLHFVLKERIGVEQISAQQVLTTGLLRVARMQRNAKMLPRHCERGEAIHIFTCSMLDCFAALAMTE
jgi:hypothetical protein